MWRDNDCGTMLQSLSCKQNLSSDVFSIETAKTKVYENIIMTICMIRCESKENK